MTKNTNTKKKASASKKLIPAIGMLTVSAMMLSTATYAWFTMSREVEVKNIQMTATVPEDIQISLGHLVDFTTAGKGDALVADASSFTGLAGNQGILKSADTNAADNGNVLPPYNKNDAVSALDWASSADISEYYRLGKIIPASSTDGWNIYFTPDAAGVGKTLKSGAKYYTAAEGLTAKTEVAETGRTAVANTDPDGSLKTTLHAINNVTEANDKWNDGTTDAANTYKTATEWNNTKDDGYYVDIPIWFRSSAQTELTLAVDAYVTTTQAKDDDDLYLAARAVVLYNATQEANGTNKGGYASAPATKASDTTKPLRIRQDNYQGESIVNYMYSTVSTGDAVASVTDNAAAYGDVTEYAGAQFLKVAGTTENGYGPMTKAIVRVWLEGEDPNCWNSNAGQDFAISLKFTKDVLKDSKAIASGETATYPDSKIDHTGTTNGQYGASDTAQSLKAGARVWVKSTTTPSGATAALTDELQFEYNGDKWSLVTDGSFHKYEGFNYKLGDTDINTSDDIATYLKNTVTSLSVVEAHDTVDEAYPVTVTAIGG